MSKANELRRFAESLVTLAKEPSVANRRLVFNQLRDRQMVQKLFDNLRVCYKEQPGGYMQVLKCGYYTGDAASMAYM